jgi:glycerol-3-phosphate dehydrogenase
VNREAAIAGLEDRFDVLIIGGGATGLGAAVDSAARGYRTALIEAADFAKATSSRSTKLVHGGVRYLRNGDFGLVREALHERTNLFHNAPHVVRDLPFIVPAYAWTEVPYYGAGLLLYDLLAGRANLARSSILSARGALERIPGLNGRGLRGAILYHDGQFDDARLALTLARTAVDRGAVVANYVRAERFVYERERLSGVRAVEEETGRTLDIRARIVVNAAGIFVDAVRALDGADTPLLTHSRGTHLVVPARVLGTTSHAIIVPQTPDNRVVFVTPWHEHVIIGTTDVVTTDVSLDPEPTPDEIRYILETANPYLAHPIGQGDISAVYAGLRPLVRRRAVATAKLSREHVIDVARSGLVSVAGGKWTTYRKMAQDVIDACEDRLQLRRVPSPTPRMPLHGAADVRARPEFLRPYGTDAAAILALSAQREEWGQRLDPRLPYLGAQVVYAARHEMARTVDDVLSRRTRALFLDARAAMDCAPLVARLLASELGRDDGWQQQQLQAFHELATHAMAV